jgi:hypothetical protein
MEAGTTGLISGRNVWQRGHSESLRFVTPAQGHPGQIPVPLTSGLLTVDIDQSAELRWRPVR